MSIEINEEDLRQKLATEVAGISMIYPWMNAGGTCRTLEEVTELTNSNSAAVVVGTVTYLARSGSSGETYWSFPDESFNKRGLPNGGFPYYERMLIRMAEVCHQAKKPIILSITGSLRAAEKHNDLVLLTNLAVECGVDLIELNLSCPNNADEPPSILTDEGTRRVLDYLCSRIDSSVKLTVKISPFYSQTKAPNPTTPVESIIIDEEKLGPVCEVINNYSNVVGVVSCNTLPGVLFYDKDKNLRSGAMGGRSLKPISLKQIKVLEKYLRPDIDIIGVGGIRTAKDVLEYQKTSPKVKAVQLCTSLIDAGVKKFDKLLDEYVDKLISAEGEENDRK